MILADTILKKLRCRGVDTRLEVDVRYLQKWIIKYPDIFPKFMRDGDFIINFNIELFRYEIRKNNI